MNISKWDHPPPLCALTGGEKYLIRAEIVEATARANATNRRPVTVTSRKALDHILTEAVWSDQKHLVILHGNDFEDDVLWKHWESQDTTIAIILVPGKTKPRILKKIPKSLVAKFESPKPWEREDWTISWLVQEARKREVSLAESYAKLLVKAIGDQDLGFLSWQLWKLEKIVKFRGEKTVLIEDIKGSLIGISSVGSLPLVKQIGYKKQQNISLYVKKAKESNHVIFPLLALLLKNLRTWITIKSMKGKDPEEIGKKLGLSSYLVKKDLLPITARWNLEQLISLFQEVTNVKSSAKWGSHDPWIHMESVLLEGVAAK